jgi:hypothetical protein
MNEPFFGAFLSVVIASIFGGVLCRLVMPQGSAATAVQMGRTWCAWMILLSTVTLFPKLLYQPFNINNLAIWLFIGLAGFGGMAFLVGWIYGNFSISDSREKGQATREREAQVIGSEKSSLSHSTSQTRSIPPQLTVIATDIEEGFWAKALEEYESSNRRQGLFARFFSQAQGNESAAKASYLKWRVEELSLEYQQHLQSQEQATSEAIVKARLQSAWKLTEPQKDYSKNSLGASKKPLTCLGCGGYSNMYIKRKEVSPLKLYGFAFFGGVPGILIGQLLEQILGTPDSELSSLALIPSYLLTYFIFFSGKTLQCPTCGNLGQVHK